MFGVISMREQNFNERVSLTQNVKNIKKEFNAKIDEFEEVIVYKYHKNSTVYNEIFPHGVTPFKIAPLSETIIKMNLAESLAAKYDSVITDAYVIAFKAIRVKFEAEASSQGMANGEVKNVIPDFKVKRREMDKQLLKNVCSIILQNLDNPTAVESFFDDYLIFPKKTKKEDDTAYTLTLSPYSNKAADISFSVDDSLLLTNTSTIPLYYYGAATADAAVPTTLKEILPDEEVEVTAVSLGAPANKFLLFLNKDSQIEGEVEIVLI